MNTKYTNDKLLSQFIARHISVMTWAQAKGCKPRPHAGILEMDRGLETQYMTFLINVGHNILRWQCLTTPLDCGRVDVFRSGMARAGEPTKPIHQGGFFHV